MAQRVDAIRESHGHEDGLLEKIFAILESSGPPPEELSAYKSTIRDARAGLRDNRRFIPVLRKLSLFALTPRQVARILYPEIDEQQMHAFGRRQVTAAEVAENPYLLSENYVPATDQPKETAADLNREQRTDGPIDYFTIDIGMFPDKRYVERDEDLLTLTVAGPERLRAFAVEALRRSEQLGHSYASLSVLVDQASSHPLFYRDSIALAAEQFLSDEHMEHFRKRLYIREHAATHFFYLQETKDAEEIVRRFVCERLKHSDLGVNLKWLDAYLENEAVELADNITDFDAAGFKAERRCLMQGALQRGIYCVTGRPGSGKTQALHTLLDRLEEAGESAIVLAPTGKAALRLRGDSGTSSTWKSETIDRWIYRSGLSKYLDQDLPLSKMEQSDRYEATDNIVIDEMSMVDVHRLALLFRAIEVHQPGSMKRVILVGDENQLPPIGCGKPFHDIIAYLREDSARAQNNLVRLTTNCRQRYDHVVLKAAHLFAGKNRYHSDLYAKLISGGEISSYLSVDYWDDAHELEKLVVSYLEGVLSEAIPKRANVSRQEAFNQLLGLYESGYVQKNETGSLDLDRAQMLTPYRGGPSGAQGLSDFVRKTYRHDAWPDRKYHNSSFAHSDKIIRTSNLYGWSQDKKKSELLLSNGSIGVLCNSKYGRKAFFPESEQPLRWEPSVPI